MKLSIIIAAYNVEKYIEKCILSCALQDVKSNEYEIIVIDDGSTDNTPYIIDNFTKKIKNIKVFHRTNHGLGATRNFGVKNSRGEYVWFVDGDDYIKKNILGQIINNFVIMKLDALVLNYAIIDSNNTLIQKNANIVTDITNNIFSGIDYYSSNFKKSYSVLFIIKRSIYINNKLTFKERINMQDSEILPKLLIHCKRMLFMPEDVYYYVQDNNSFTNSNDGKKRYQYFKSIIVVKKSLEEFSETIIESNPIMHKAISNKIRTLDTIIFTHVVYFKYDKDCLKKIIRLLKKNDFFPFKNKTTGKMSLIKKSLNLFPISTKFLIDLIR